MIKHSFKQYPISEEIESTCLFYASPDKKNGITGSMTYNHNRGIFINLMSPIDFNDGMILYAESDMLNHFTFFNVKRRIPIEEEDSSVDDKNKLLNAEFMLMSAAFPHGNTFDRISFELVDLWKWYPNGRKWHHNRKTKNRKFVSLPVMPEFSITSASKTFSFKNEPVILS